MTTKPYTTGRGKTLLYWHHSHLALFASALPPESPFPSAVLPAPALVDMSVTLLAIGGTRVVIPFADVYACALLLLPLGHALPRLRIVRRPGQPSACHENCLHALHADKKGTLHLWTGFGLTDADGTWRRHSWLVDKKTIIETTETRAQYWGTECDAELRRLLFGEGAGGCEACGEAVSEPA